MTVSQQTTESCLETSQNIELLKKHFTHCFDKNGHFDLQKFKEDVSENRVDFYKESYEFDWSGKLYAKALTRRRINTLLSDDCDFNQKEDNSSSQNLFLQGDSLDILKHLANAHYEAISMIFMTLPSNTVDNPFFYKTQGAWSVEEFQSLVQVDRSEAQQILDCVHSKNFSHSVCLAFIYPRLFLSRCLLKDNGVIFVCVDDTEVSELRCIMDEIFGEDNCVAQMVWQYECSNSPSNKHCVPDHNYVLCYAKNKDLLKPFVLPREDTVDSRYKNPDNDPRGVWKGGDLSVMGIGKNRYPIVTPSGKTVFPPKGRSWRVSQEKLQELLREEKIFFGKKGENIPCYKRFLSEVKEGVTPTSLWLCDTDEKQEKDSLSCEDVSVFSSKKKPTRWIQNLCKMAMGRDSNDTVLDCFADSATIAKVLYQLNEQDGGNRRFILLTDPKMIDSFSATRSHSSVEENTPIFERIKQDLKDLSQRYKKSHQMCLDCGFKIFKTIPIPPHYLLKSDALTQETELFFDQKQLSKDRLRALLWTWKSADASPLTEPMKNYDFGGYRGYFVNKTLYLMDKGFSTEQLRLILEKIDTDISFYPQSIVAFGYHFDSKTLSEIAENVKFYKNTKTIDIEFKIRYEPS